VKAGERYLYRFIIIIIIIIIILSPGQQAVRGI